MTCRTIHGSNYDRALAAALYLRHTGWQNYVDGRLLRNVDPDGVVDPGDFSSFTFEDA